LTTIAGWDYRGKGYIVHLGTDGERATQLIVDCTDGRSVELDIDGPIEKHTLPWMTGSDEARTVAAERLLGDDDAQRKRDRGERQADL
jgi:hypothetical protein